MLAQEERITPAAECRSMNQDKSSEGESITRRGAITALLGAGLALGCGGSDGASETTDAEASGADGADGTVGASNGESGAAAAEAGAVDTGTCEVTPEGEIGPYFADDSAAGFQRSDVRSNLDGTSTQPGVPLTLTVTVVDANKGCAPYVGAQVDIWHCNASGVYSDIESESTASEQWLRGYQLTDGSGRLTFQTIVPGWYQGRTTHIHLRVRSTYSEASSTSDETNTTQCFFDQTFIDTLYTTVAPYSAEGKNPTTNASDRVYSEQEDGANVLALTGDDASGYSAEVAIVLPITATYDAQAPAGGPPGGGGPPGETG
jgi:protocatechuate 3,4-dioxygenase beta subunit